MLEEWTSENSLSLIRDTSTASARAGLGDSGTPVYSQYFTSGDSCSCNVFEFFGSEAAGSFVRGECSGVNPICNALNTTGTYSKSIDTLTITPESEVNIIFTSIIKSTLEGKELREKWTSSSELAVIQDTSTASARAGLGDSGTPVYSQPDGSCYAFMFFGTQSSGSFVRRYCSLGALNTTGTYYKSIDTLTITPESETNIIFK